MLITLSLLEGSESSLMAAFSQVSDCQHHHCDSNLVLDIVIHRPSPPIPRNQQQNPGQTCQMDPSTGSRRLPRLVVFVGCRFRPLAQNLDFWERGNTSSCSHQRFSVQCSLGLSFWAGTASAVQWRSSLPTSRRQSSLPGS